VLQVRWVVTVPAVWRDVAKSFMRKAAHEAGCVVGGGPAFARPAGRLRATLTPPSARAHQRSLIPEFNSDNLVLALEPEGACLASEKDTKGFLKQARAHAAGSNAAHAASLDAC
jgi:hypothetical protein